MAEPHGGGRIWSSSFGLASALSFFASMVFYLLLTAMAVYAVERFAANDALAGFASSAFILSSVIARSLSPLWILRWGRRRILIVGTLAYVVLSASYPFLDHMGLLIAVRILHGIAFGATGTAVASGVMLTLPEHRRAEGAGYFGVASTLGTALGPLSAVWLLERTGFESLFIGATAFSVAALVAALLLRWPDGHREPGVSRASRLRLADFLAPEVLPVGTVILLGGLAYSSVLAYLLPFALSIDAPWAAGVFFTVYAVVVIASRLTMGRIQDRRGDNTVMYPTLIAFLLGFVALSLTQDGLTLVASAALIGFGFGSLLPAMQALAVRLVPRERTSTAMAAVYVMLDTGTGLGPLILGLVLGTVGFPAMFTAAAAIVGAALVTYTLVHGTGLGRQSPR